MPRVATKTTALQRGVDHIGVSCVFYCHDGRGNWLLHQRSQNCRDEQGNWDCGGGSLEFGEDFDDAVRREIKEEYQADVTELQYLATENVLRKHNSKPTHWVALIFVARVDPSQVTIGEPNKISDIGWFKPDNFPTPPHSNLLHNFEHVKRAGLA